ncbi:hypothetical protein HU200_055026 [Digitaria exilis]|uniref:UV-stimulated scaffold protein A C-terminal domain-containing protein n=1 Tax=Digitaria exilis TaxID=1010633 RepID=A0A835E3M8_9POAL|nr:hypothetical protein HU200_055026 [Digitaria exilis]
MPRPTVSSFAGHRTPAAAIAEAELGSNPSSSAAVMESSMASLIERATSTTAPAVDPVLLRAIKSAARASDGAIRDAFRLLLSLMSKPHSHVRLLAFSIADELFMRSKLFRSLLADALDGFLPLAVGFRRADPLPPPATSAALLRKAAVQALERWHHLFGAHYRQLRLAVEYLKVSARVQFPGLRATVEVRAAREARTQEILAAKVEQLRENFAPIKAEIRSTIVEIRNGLEVIRAEYEKFEGYVNDDDAELEIASLSMRSIRMASLMAGEWVPETQENEAVFDALREAYRLLVSKHLVTVKEWISVLVRVNLQDNRFRDSALKEFIDVKNEIQAVRGRCSELGLDLDNIRRRKGDQEEEDDEFWGCTCKPEGLELESHWGRVDNDAVIPAAKIAELNVHSSVYREAPVEILPCHAPLKKGRLCQRRDLKVCPFHGPIVPRDAEGNPIEQHSGSSDAKVDTVEHCDVRGSSNVLNIKSDGDYMEEASSSRMPDISHDYGNTAGTHYLGKITVEQLAQQAIKNVRKRDIDHKAQERAQRQRIRQHNEDVLREAAIASTSHSAAAYEQPPEAWGRRGRRGKTKEPTLASMLKKKVTSKDRIADRLLNTRATDATIREASHNEDISYREAFPNQW